MRACFSLKKAFLSAEKALAKEKKKRESGKPLSLFSLEEKKKEGRN